MALAGQWGLEGHVQRCWHLRTLSGARGVHNLKDQLHQQMHQDYYDCLLCKPKRWLLTSGGINFRRKLTTADPRPTERWWLCCWDSQQREVPRCAHRRWPFLEQHCCYQEKPIKILLSLIAEERQPPSPHPYILLSRNHRECSLLLHHCLVWTLHCC